MDLGSKTMHRRVPVLCLAILSTTLPGCIVVSSHESDYERIEEKKADAQYLAARAEMERINLERQKAGLPPVEIPAASHPPKSDCDGKTPNDP